MAYKSEHDILLFHEISLIAPILLKKKKKHLAL